MFRNFSKAIFVAAFAVASIAFVACGDDDSVSSNGKKVIEEDWVPMSWEDEGDSLSSSSAAKDSCGSKSCADSLSSSSVADSLAKDSTAKDSQTSSPADSSAKDSTAKDSLSSAAADSIMSSSSSAFSSSSSKIVRPEFKEVQGIHIRQDTVSKGDYIYKTVQIGTKIWLAENLQTEVQMSKCYDDSVSNCKAMGRLYRTDAVGCPYDYRIPTQADWEELFATAKSIKALRDKDSWNTSKENIGTDDFGFSLLATGSCDLDTCTDINKNTRVWTTEPYGQYIITADSDEPVFKKGLIVSMYVATRCVTDATDLYSVDDLPKGCKNGTRYSIRDSLYYESSDSTWKKSVESNPTTCTDKEEGDSTYYKGRVYNCRSNEWRTISLIDETLGFCTSKKQGDTITYVSTIYVCDTAEWRKANFDDIYGDCKKDEWDTIISYAGKNYVCMDSSWRTATSTELKYGICTKAKDYTYSDEAKNYICKNHSWKTPTKLDILGPCTLKNTTEKKVYEDTTYFCKDTVWKKATESDMLYGPCVSSNEGERAEDKYICKNSSWHLANYKEYLGTCSSNNQGEVIKYFSTNYICNNNVWRSLSSDEEKYGLCTSANEGTIKDNRYICSSGKWKEGTKDEILGQCNYANRNTIGKYGSTYYTCEDNLWRTSTAAELRGPCTEELQDSIAAAYICDNLKWRTKSYLESYLGYCTTTKTGNTGMKGNYYYICYEGDWKEVNALTYELGVCETRGEEKVYNDTIYSCTYEGISNTSWQNTNVNATLGTCTSDNFAEVKTYNEQDYVCRSTKKWELPTEVEKYLGYCNSDTEGKTGYNAEDTAYVCTASGWSKATKTTFLGKCSTIGEKKDFYGQEYECDAEEWRPNYGTLTDTRDGKTYRTIILKRVEWMADNLNYKTDNSWCYSNTESECDEFGRLYTFEAAQTACPAGWHVPEITADYMESFNSSLGYKTKSVTTWQGSNGTGYSELDVKGSGFRRANGSFDYKSRLGGFWMNQAYDETYAFVDCFTDATNSVKDECYGSANSRGVPEYTSGNTTSLLMYVSNIANAYPVRCVKDHE